jgi:2-keto-4-pentenoate hydratase/2-oxohepta-3-ene-1,7-dioic acid hydratase in catechol pathway
MFSKQGSNIKESDWEEYVGGYFLCMDITNAATTTETASKQTFPWNLQWDLA